MINASSLICLHMTQLQIYTAAVFSMELEQYEKNEQCEII